MFQSQSLRENTLKNLLGDAASEKKRQSLFNFNSGSNRGTFSGGGSDGFGDQYTRSMEQYKQPSFLESLLGKEGDSINANPFEHLRVIQPEPTQEVSPPAEQGVLRERAEGEDLLAYLESQVTPGAPPVGDELERRMAVIAERNKRYGKA